MTIQWKNPKGGQCCECRPSVCDPCSACPTADSIELTVSGIAACCSVSNTRITGLEAVNGMHTLTRQVSGDYTLVLPGAVSIQSFAAGNCTTLFSTAGPYDVTIAFSCDDESAVLDIRLTASSVRLLYQSITPPDSGGVFAFAGGAACAAFTPYTYGGMATI